MKDSVSTTAVPSIPTMLPTTCGEETDLPGVPRVGCVATVAHRPNSLHGFAASIIATADSVAILGPDLEQRRRGRHCLFTRHLWRPASLVEAAAASGAQSGAAGHGSSLSSSPSSPLTAATTAGMLAHADGSGINVIALTACSLSPLAAKSTTANSESAHPAEGGVSDAVAVAVAWADIALQHHVTVLVLHLTQVLSPSWTGHVDGSLVRVVAQDALPLPPAQSVLRLFYHPIMTASRIESAEGTAGPAESKHVIMCSLFSPWSAASAFGGGSGRGQHSHTDGGSSGGTVVGSMLKKTNAASLSSGGAAVTTAERVASHGSSSAAAASPRRRGYLRFLTVSAEIRSDKGTTVTLHTEDELVVKAYPSDLEDVAPWLRRFQIDRVVCAFTVQSATTRVIAAAGTTDGRVFTLGPTSHRLVRRVSGPVADAVFAPTKPAKAETALRSAVVDEILTDAIAEDAFKNGSFTSAADVEFARRDENGFTALVILDSAGHLLVLRAVNSGAPITQTVPDLPQVITLANRQKQTLTFVSPSMTNVVEEAQISSKNFLDLSSLRHFIGRPRTAPPPQPRRMHGSTSPGNAPLASGSLTATPVDASFSFGSTDEPVLSGHILSRGLLCVTNIEWGRGGSELVVSTMGQVVVSVPFSPTEGCFRIAGFTVTPAPMFYVGFVDFFANGSPTLVMAGLKNVLVASRPQSTIRERAQLLLRLLSKKELEQRHTDTDESVDS